MDKNAKNEVIEFLKKLHDEEEDEVSQFFKDRGKDLGEYYLEEMDPEESCVWESGFLAGIRHAINAIRLSESEQIH